jgi:hypothetical protein
MRVFFSSKPPFCRSGLHLLNLPIVSYLQDVDPIVSQLALDINEDGNPSGEYGDFENKAHLQAVYKANPFDLNDPSAVAAAVAAAAVAAAAGPAPRSAPRAPRSNTAAASDTELDEEFYDSEDNSVSSVVLN